MKELRLKISRSKADEIDIIETLAAAFRGQGLYLSSLFTPAFCKWVIGQIKNDLAPDMFEALTDDEDRARYEAALYDLRSEIERTRNNAAFAQQKLASAQEILMGELSKAESDVTCLRDRCDQLQDDNARLAYANNDLMRVNKQLDDELLRLKARLFDLVDQSEVEKQLKAIPSQ